MSTLRTVTPLGALTAFTCAIVLWGWHELTFLMGVVTGPRMDVCPPGARGWPRFILAASTLIYHEIALALTAAVLIAVTWGEPNAVGGWTFLTLTLSRLSSKLNLFLGVPNFTDSFFPRHLRHLTSYVRKGPVNALFPFSMALLLAAAALEAQHALEANGGAFEAAAFALLFALTGLALVEHLFMVLPLPDAALWSWALPASERKPRALPADI
jgi:putative photosynthetic complex assembly protein 2